MYSPRLGFSIEGSELAAILGWAILRGAPRRSCIIENNINQTLASAANGASAGMMFTLPALHRITDLHAVSNNAWRAPDENVIFSSNVEERWSIWSVGTAPNGTSLYYRSEWKVLRLGFGSGRLVGTPEIVSTSRTSSPDRDTTSPTRRAWWPFRSTNAAIPDKIRVVTGFFGEICRVWGHESLRKSAPGRGRGRGPQRAGSRAIWR